MRFAFCQGDVPDWLLSQTFVVASISAVKIKLLAKLIIQHASTGQTADEEKLQKLAGGDKLATDELKGVVAALHFILTCSARYDVAEETLALELQQLGLPKEHTEALVAALKDGKAPLQRHLAGASLKLASLESMRWRAHAAEDASSSADGEEETAAVPATVEFMLGVRDQPPPTSANSSAEPPPLRPVSFRVDADQLALLHAELRAARDAMEAAMPKQ